MLSLFSRYTIRANVVGAFALALVCTIGLGLFSVQRLDAVNAAAADIRNNWLPSTRLLGRMAQIAERLRSEQGAALLLRTGGKQQQFGDLLSRQVALFDSV